MLNRELVVKELSRLSDQLFAYDAQSYDLVLKTWQTIAKDQTFKERIKSISTPWPLPSWHEPLKNVHSIDPIDAYAISSVDGSQIYPDRHQNISCFLINIGAVSLRYNLPYKPVSFSSYPYIFTGQEDELELEVSNELVNCKRQELEFQGGVKISQSFQQKERSLIIFDGSLIFWHLEAKDTVFKDTYLSKYILSLLQLHKSQTITASYISAPKSKELINLIKVQLSDFDPKQTHLYQSIERITDAALMRAVLPEFHRSIVFKNHAKVSDLYPTAVHPHFFYINVGHEVGRVEIPGWIASSPKQVDLVAQIVLDQCKKGGGYPVALAEAHEQAVVKGPDRDFFYHNLTKLGVERKRSHVISFKLLKKKGLGI